MHLSPAISRRVAIEPEANHLRKDLVGRAETPSVDLVRLESRQRTDTLLAGDSRQAAVAVDDVRVELVAFGLLIRKRLAGESKGVRHLLTVGGMVNGA